MGYLSNIKKQYLINLFSSLIPAYVIERLFWQQRGMDVGMVVACEILYAITVTLLEIPSGILADRFGRKRMICLCGLFSVAEMAILLFSTRFWHFAAAIFLAGIGKSLVSGSENALIYDSLAAEGRQEDFERVLGRLSAVDFGGSVLAALCGGVLANVFRLEFNYLLSVASLVIAFLVSLSLREPPLLTASESELTGPLQYTKEALGVFRLQPAVLLYCLTGAVLGGCMIYLDEFWQLIMEQVEVPVLFFGVISGLLLCARIPGNLFAYKLKERLRLRSIFTGLLIAAVAGYMAVFLVRDALVILPMVLICFLAGIADPLVAGYLHHHTESHIRATVESFSSLALRVVSAGVGLVFGAVSGAYSVFAGFIVLAAVCGGYLALYQLFAKRLKPQSDD